MTPNTPTHAAETARPIYPRRLVARFLFARDRQTLTAAIDQGRLHERDQLDILAPENLPALANQSLRLLLGSTAGFVALNLVARWARHTSPLFGTGSPLLRVAELVLANLGAYAVILPLHEALHAAVILALGGRPRFGVKLPLALYCSAPGQLFTRTGYIVVILAPLVVLTVAGAVVSWAAPNLGAYILFGLVGNVAGAVADLDAVAHLRRLPSDILVEDTQSGYTAFQPYD